MPVTPTLADVINTALENRLIDVHTAMPGTVVTYNASSKTADIAPQFKRSLRDEDEGRVSETIPNFPNVPVVFPGGGQFEISWQLNPGDYVMVIFSERNIGEWQQSGRAVDPGDLRTHELSGAVAFPGIRPATDTGPSNNQPSLVLSAPQIHIGSETATEAMVLGTALKTWLDTHTHPAPGGATSPPMPLSPASILSTKTKVE